MSQEMLEVIDRIISSKVVNTIVVQVDNVCRGRTAQELLNTTGFRQDTDEKSVATMPLIGNGGPLSGEFVWLKCSRGLFDAEVERERVRLGLVRDLEMQLHYIGEHPEWADTHPNGDSWPVGDNKNHDYISLYRWRNGFNVSVKRSRGGRWSAGKWFGGRRE